jgi:hypothetical protein
MEKRLYSDSYLEWFISAGYDGIWSQHHKTGDIIFIILKKESKRYDDKDEEQKWMCHTPESGPRQ